MKTLADRFWPKVDKTETCWAWTGCRTSLGYGQIRGDGGRVQYAHRIAYELLVGQIPDDAVLDHLCRNASCVNPEHLEAVTQRVNVLRGVGPSARQARQTQCVRNHDLAGENLMLTEGGKKRRCRECVRLHNMARRLGVHIDALVCREIEKAEGWIS